MDKADIKYLIDILQENLPYGRDLNGARLLKSEADLLRQAQAIIDSWLEDYDMDREA